MRAKTLTKSTGNDPALGGVLGLLAGYPIGLTIGVGLGGGLVGVSLRYAPVFLGAAVGTWAPLIVFALGLHGDTPLLWGLLALTGLVGALTGSYRRR